jgi:GT2 family glycosyltransferase
LGAYEWSHENYFSYCTDDDLIQEAWHAGVRKFWMVHDSLVYHLQGKSNNQQKLIKIQTNI